MAAPHPQRRLSSQRARRGERGWALLTILLMCAVFVITMAAVFPIASFETRRQREQDLMYRGKDYMRAIQLYYRKFRRYPSRIEDLENTNQIRFLRRRWKDPMTGSDEWRLIHVNPAGILVDSVIAAAPGVNGATGQPGGPSAFGQFSQPSQPSSGGQPSGSSQPPSFNAFNSVGGSVPGTSVGYSGGSPSDGSTPGTGSGGSPTAQFIMSSAGGSSSSSGFSSGQVVGGALIAGVASKSTHDSIMVYNTRQKYNEWEFVYDPRKDPLMTPQAGAVQPGQTGLPGATGAAAPPTGFGGNPPNSNGVGVPVPNPTNPHP
jgi:type II secretory pathway pseudopilin PulG